MTNIKEFQLKPLLKVLSEIQKEHPFEE